MICVGKCCVAAYVCLRVCVGAILYLSSVTSVCCHLPSPAVAFQTNVYMNLPYTIINTLHLNTHAHKHTRLMFLFSKCCYCISHTYTHPYSRPSQCSHAPVSSYVYFTSLNTDRGLDRMCFGLFRGSILSPVSPFPLQCVPLARPVPLISHHTFCPPTPPPPHPPDIFSDILT